MEYYLIFIFLIIFLSLFNLNLPTVLTSIVLFYGFLNSFNIDQLSFIFLNNLKEITSQQELIAIPFLLLTSELFLRFGYFEHLKKFIFKDEKSNFFKFFVFFTIASTSISSVAIFNNMFMRVFKKSEFKNQTELYLKMQYFLTSLGLLMPISIPVFILTSILKVSLKKTIILSLGFGVIIFILYYLIFIKNTFSPYSEDNKKFDGKKVAVLLIFPVLFYSLIFLFSYSISSVAEILFIYSFVFIFLQNRADFLQNFYESLRNAINRSGTILSVIFLIYIINFFHIYSHSTIKIFDFMLTNLSNSAYSLVFIYIVAFFLSIILDPLGIILVLSPIYESVIDVYGINPYSFLLSFIFFLSIGLSNNIVGLPGNIYRENYKFDTHKINEIILFEHLIIILIAFFPLLYGIFK